MQKRCRNFRMPKMQSKPVHKTAGSAHKIAVKGPLVPRKAAVYVCMFVALCFIGIGLLRGENLVVLQKAVHICLECIGIG